MRFFVSKARAARRRRAVDALNQAGQPWASPQDAGLMRLTTFVLDHPNVELIHGSGYWQASWVTGTHQLVIVTRHRLADLLDELEELE